MSYTSEDFEDGKCPSCGSGDVEKEHNLANIGFFSGMGYFLDFPFGADYTCNDCGAKSDDCFIATAVYGDTNAPEVNTLRQFRDKVLMNSAAGRALVQIYYSGFGKTAAQLIKAKMPELIPTIKSGLDRLVERYSEQLNSGDKNDTR